MFLFRYDFGYNGMLIDTKVNTISNDLIDLNTTNSYEEYEKNSKLLDVLHPAGMVSTFDKYYIDDSCLMINNVFPYMLRDGELLWNVSYSEVTVGDFFETHPECIHSGIEFETGIPAAGGHERIFGKAAVEIIIKALEATCPVLGFSVGTLKVIAEMIAKLSEYYADKNISPIQDLDAILNSGSVGIIAIEELLNFDRYHAHRLLMALGFKYDEKKDKYTIGTKERLHTRNMLKCIKEEELKYL